MVDRDTARVELLSRQDERAWLEDETIEGLDAVLRLPAIEVDIPLREIYRDVFAA